ncbi:hypothetical protein ACE193_07375 [Bernardetia sp. OM2101]|uniref:hypothetical protein n=1 Tax=Bernardetia sp. OM2101 TaxID=3344876 RepID=UPI0035D0DC6F
MEIKEEWKQILDNLPDESNTLDYKVKFYDLKDENGKKNKRQIVEMARDVNAFLNSPREGSAFILCGVADKSSDLVGKERIIGLHNQSVNTDLVYSCLEDYIEITAKINVENFFYDDKNLCVIEIDIPSKGHKSRFSTEFIQIDKENPKKSIDIPKNTFFFRKKDKNIINTRISHVEEIELSSWLRSQTRYEPEVEEFIDNNLILLNKELWETERLLKEKFDIDKKDAEIIINYRDKEIKQCRKELSIDKQDDNEGELNKKILKKYRINNRLYIPLIDKIKKEEIQEPVNYPFPLAWFLSILLIIGFIFGFSIWYANNLQEIECKSKKCTSLKVISNFYHFKQIYQKSECDCDGLLVESFEKHIDSLIIKEHYLAARLFLIDNAYMVGFNSFNHKLETVVNKDSSLSIEQKSEFLDKYRRVK